MDGQQVIACSFIELRVKEIYAAWKNVSSEAMGSNHRKVLYIDWKSPKEDWIAVNFDGVRKDLLVIACAGYFWDCDNHWLLGYQCSLNSYEALEAKLWGDLLFTLYCME